MNINNKFENKKKYCYYRLICNLMPNITQKITINLSIKYINMYIKMEKKKNLEV